MLKKAVCLPFMLSRVARVSRTATTVASTEPGKRSDSLIVNFEQANTLPAKRPSLIGTAGCVIRTCGGVGPVAELTLGHRDPIRRGWFSRVNRPS